MKKFLMMAALMVATLTVSAQEYNYAAGIRLGGFEGATFKMYQEKTAIEFGAAWGIGGYLIADAVYELQQPVINEDFTFYYGAGPYLGLFTNSFLLGAEAVIGLEYQIPNVPIAISLDYRPGLNILKEIDFNPGNVGLGIKYCF